MFEIRSWRELLHLPRQTGVVVLQYLGLIQNLYCFGQEDTDVATSTQEKDLRVNLQCHSTPFESSLTCGQLELASSWGVLQECVYPLHLQHHRATLSISW